MTRGRLDSAGHAGQTLQVMSEVESHRPGNGAKFTRVEMSEMFMRVWLKKGNRWQIIAGSVNE